VTDSMANTNAHTVAIVGQGYVGLPLAMAAVKSGWQVIGIDNSKSRVVQLNNGLSPVEDVTNLEIKTAIQNGKYLASVDPADVSRASVVIICVPTPLNELREPDLDLLKKAITDISPYISEGTLILSESTSYPGTLREVIIPLIMQLKADATKSLYFASAPERVNPGDRVWNQENTPRLVGGIDEESQKRAIEFYNSVCSKVVSTPTPEIAEAAKILENTFRLVNIALINEFAELCHAQGIDVHEVISAAATKPYGFMPFTPGVGVGGHCIPVDPLYLTWWAKKSGVEATLVERADEIAVRRPKYVADRVFNLIGDKKETSKVLIMGVAYKAGISDVRETPVKLLRSELIERGAEVAWLDPMVSTWEGTQPVTEQWDCDVAVVATNQPGMDVNSLLSRGVPVLDCTNNYGNLTGVELL
jgi:UDP-N-acetyl-D-glucosamine dehydrogenase